jgi:hypothetical protein
MYVQIAKMENALKPCASLEEALLRIGESKVSCVFVYIHGQIADLIGRDTVPEISDLQSLQQSHSGFTMQILLDPHLTLDELTAVVVSCREACEMNRRGMLKTGTNLYGRKTD